MILPRIHALPPELANQIAAGEVVERPASIVKELLENSLDANAKNITITIKGGGTQLINVQDDGVGIHPADLTLAVSRHATSKIMDASQLSAIQTLGFRGEALASISSVSELTLTSRALNADTAWQVIASGREMLPIVKPASHPEGTSVVVKNLFYNTPARKNFLRSTKTEWQAIVDVIIRIALSRFDVAFTVFHDGKRILQCPAILEENQAFQRIAALLSHAVTVQSKTFSDQITCARLHGWVAEADFSRSSSDWQFFYVNGRIVKDKLIQHAIRQAYGEKLLPGRYAIYVMYLDIDPSKVDVNVHPTKHEVRFHYNRTIHDFIVKTIQTTLYNTPVENTFSSIMDALMDVATNSDKITRREVMPVTYRDKEMIVKAIDDSPQLGHALTILENNLIITETPKGDLGVVHIHAAISCSLLYHLLLESEIKRKPLLIPETLSDPLAARLEQREIDMLQSLGFVVELMGKQEYIVREVPAFLEYTSVHAAISSIVKMLKHKSRQNDPRKFYSTLACACAPEEGTPVTQPMIAAALRATETIPPGIFCQHGLFAWQIFTPHTLTQGIDDEPIHSNVNQQLLCRV